jgi:hypothetical protein
VRGGVTSLMDGAGEPAALPTPTAAAENGAISALRHRRFRVYAAGVLF